MNLPAAQLMVSQLPPLLVWPRGPLSCWALLRLQPAVLLLLLHEQCCLLCRLPPGCCCCCCLLVAVLPLGPMLPLQTAWEWVLLTA